MAPAREIKGLRCDESFRSAAAKVVWTRFDEMMSFTEVALAGEDIEGVHDMRVGSRRLRAALDNFDEVFSRRRLRPYVREIKELADALGAVRDLDVMIDKLSRDEVGRPPSQRLVLEGMIAEMRAERETARRALKKTVARLESGDFGRRFLTFVARETE